MVVEENLQNQANKMYLPIEIIWVRLSCFNICPINFFQGSSGNQKTNMVHMKNE